MVALAQRVRDMLADITQLIHHLVRMQQEAVVVQVKLEEIPAQIVLLVQAVMVYQYQHLP